MSSVHEQFEKIRESLFQNLSAAHMHYYQYWSIRKLISESPSDFEPSRHFWTLFLNAQLETARLCLSRAYDKNRQSASLQTWLNLIKKNFSVLIPEDSYIIEALNTQPLGETELADDLALLDTKEDPLIKSLTVQRGNIYAHSSATSDIDNLMANFPLTNQDFDLLLERGERLFNRYSIIYDGRVYAMSAPGQDDYKLLISHRKDEMKSHEH